ncbi:MAG: hypothetical protein GY830_02485 [Bacteroidetes bacterium]|nr:hypothetical protein [Bacteroidota bacterium]
MKSFKKVLLVIFSLGALINVAFAEGLLADVGISLSGDFAFNSSYIFRGQKLDSADVMQSGLYAEGYGLSLGVWKSQTSKTRNFIGSEEIDYIIGYSRGFGLLTLGLGYTYYDYPMVAGDSLGDLTGEREVSFTLGIDMSLAPSVLIANNYTNDILYYEISLGHSIELVEYISASFGLVGGFFNSEVVEGFGFYDISLGFDFQLTDNLIITPNIHYVSPEGDLDHQGAGNQDDEIYGGIVLGYNF